MFPRSDPAPPSLRLLGRRPGLLLNGETRVGRVLALLTYLRLGPASATRDELMELLWDPTPGDSPQHRLRQLLFAGRKALPDGVLVTEGRTVRLLRECLPCDVAAFRRAAAQGRLEDAVALFEADFLSGAIPSGAMLFEEWASEYGRSLRRELEGILRALVIRSSGLGQYREAVVWAERHWLEDTDDEDRAEVLIRMLAKSGDYALVPSVAARMRTRLTESGLDVPEALDALLRDVPVPIRPELPSAPAPPEAVPTVEPPATVAPSTPPDPPAPSPWRRTRAGLVPVAGAAVLLAATLASFALRGGTSGPAGSPADVFGGAGLLVFQGADGGARALRFVGPGALDTADARMENADSLLRWGDLRSLATGAVLSDCIRPGTDNREVCVQSEDGARPEPITTNPGEDVPIGWSPDGAWALFLSDSGSEPGAYRYDAHALHLASGTPLQVSDNPFQNNAAWSPDGSRIAVLSNVPDGDSLRIVTVDGAEVSRYGFAGRIGFHWSPDGRDLLVVEVRSDADGQSGLYLVRPGESPVSVQVPLLTSVAAARWSPDGAHMVLTGRAGRARKVVICRAPACPVAELELPSVALLAYWIPDAPPRWVERIALNVEPAALEVGESATVTLRSLDQNGAAFTPPEVRILELDPEIGFLDSTGVFHATRPGVARLVATHGGWRADTVRVVVTRGEPYAAALEEDWEDGIDTTTWKAFGVPLPEVVAGRGGRSFRSNGDSLYPSGVVTRVPWNLSRGFTVEWRQSTPLTGELWQEVWLEFSLGPLDAFVEQPGEPYPVRATRIQVAAPILHFQPPVPKLTLMCGGWERNEGYPDHLTRGDWHAFALQVHPDGRCELFIDGRLSVTVDGDPGSAFDQPLYFWVGGRSVRTDVLLDDLALWRGLRWVAGREGEAIGRCGGGA